MTRLTYIANTKLNDGERDYQPGDDVSSFAPKIPHISGHIEAGLILLKGEDGTDFPPRTHPKMHPYIWGCLLDDVADAGKSEAEPEADAESLGEDEAPLAADDGEPDGADAPEDDTEPGAFDPAEHTIPEVLEHVEAHPEQAEQIAEAEAAGKDRVTLMEELVPFDPAEHTVQEVLDYLDAHPDDLGYVLAAEAEGKARTTLLDKLEALTDDDE